MLRHALLLLLVAACSNSKGGQDAGVVACPPCVIDSDCANGGICSQLGGDSYCAAPCPNGDECTDTQQCVSVVTVTGDQASVCVDPTSTTCGPNPPADNDAGSTCPGFADPSTTASCTSCQQTSQTCQPNGCYGGWYCNLQTNKCQAPSSCAPIQDAGPPPQVYDGGITGTIGPSGGTESVLYFAVVGDTRPATEDDTAHYPTAIISKIFADLTAVKPAPPFVVSTGDYQFSNPYANEAAAQLKLYLGARGSYAGVQFPAMGNHECTGGTASNCGQGNTNGITNNYTAFMSQLLGPIQQTLPYYAINVNASDSSWTAKFVFVAGNAWDGAQSSWLDATLAQSTTYTFIVRHEPASANTAPGVTPSETIMAKYPYTLAIVGHSHEYHHSKYTNPKEVIIGNGGAPLALNQNYGYALVAQRTDGSLQVDMFDYQTQQPDTQFRFAVKADGSPAP